MVSNLKIKLILKYILKFIYLLPISRYRNWYNKRILHLTIFGENVFISSETKIKFPKNVYFGANTRLVGKNTLEARSGIVFQDSHQSENFTNLSLQNSKEIQVLKKEDTLKKQKKKKIIFVCTTGRSGSKTIIDVLNQHSKIEAYHEPRRVLIRLSAQYAHGLIDDIFLLNELKKLYQILPDNKSLYVESDQKLGNLIPHLKQIFPEAKFVWLIRNGYDFVASAYMRGWFKKEEYINPEQHYLQFSEYRLNASLCEEMSFVEWEERESFERCCWYWSYWNNIIKENLEQHAPNDYFILKLESFAHELKELLVFMGQSSQNLTVTSSNSAKRYKPLKKENWNVVQKAIFRKYCNELMCEFYSD